MMGSYTKLYKDQLDIKNYKNDMKKTQSLKGLNYDQVKEVRNIILFLILCLLFIIDCSQFTQPKLMY